MGRPLRAGEHRRTRRAVDAGILPGAPRLLRDDGGAPGPTPQGLAGTRPRLGVVAGRVDTGAGAATGARAGDAGGVHRHPGRAARGPRGGSRLGGDPHRRRRHGARARCPRSPAWHGPGPRRCCSGWPSGAPARRRHSPWCSRRWATGFPTALHSTRCASPLSTSPTTPPTALASGPVARASARSHRWCRASRGAPASGRHVPCARDWSPGRQRSRRGTSPRCSDAAQAGAPSSSRPRSRPRRRRSPRRSRAAGAPRARPGAPRPRAAASPDPAVAVGGRHREPVDGPSPTVPACDHGPDDRSCRSGHDERARVALEQAGQSSGRVGRGGCRRLTPQRQHSGDVCRLRRAQIHVHRVMLGSGRGGTAPLARVMPRWAYG